MTQFKEKTGKNREGARSASTLIRCCRRRTSSSTRRPVPVGEDQKQHVELTRDIALKFNNDFDIELFVVPEPYIGGGASARIMSLRDGNAKMSKSDPSDMSRINLTDSDDAIAQKIRKAKTDPEPLPDDPKGIEGRPEAKNLVGIYAAVTDESVEQVLARFAGQGFGAFKPALADALIALIAPIRARLERASPRPGGAGPNPRRRRRPRRRNRRTGSRPGQGRGRRDPHSDALDKAAPSPPSERPLPLSQRLAQIIAEPGPDRLTFSELAAQLHSRAWGGLLFIFAAINTLPLPPGTNIFFAIPLVIVAAQMAFGRASSWFPARIDRRGVTRAELERLIHKMAWLEARVERIFKPRLPRLTGPTAARLISFACFVLSIAAAIPIPAIHVAPAGTIVLFALALIYRDGLLVIAAVFAAIIALMLEVLIIAYGFVVLTYIASWLGLSL